ncbi:MAG: hypothetical protein CMO98_09305 [Woeseia sp.]|nr:hypothetical protein [Woeseia sp.]|tara:strand:+ start:4377 stop:4973 length:597 start_codon:yes stop_codon:yes gene_type:complete
MGSDFLTRRLFMQGSGTALGGALARARLPAFIAVSQAACTAKNASNHFKNITNAEAREIIAIAARILPTTNTPGATEAGAVYFFDEAFGTIFSEMAVPARLMLSEFQKNIPNIFPGAQVFSDLNELEQDTYLQSVEETPFFQGARFMTLAGVFGMAKYGGNHNNVGWQLAGMPGPPQAWAHPFGDYDAAYESGETDGT